MAEERVRIFISSPGDVTGERRRAALVVQQLNRDFDNFFAVEAYQWEHEAQLASGHFQDNIKPPSQFDIVVLILWSRLGTYLPAAYAGADGRAPVTGTEWEYEHARDHHGKTGLPDLLVFRNRSDYRISSEPGRRAEQLRQIMALDAFWQRHFEDEGIFLTAHTSYRELDEFEEKLAIQLRALLQRRIDAAQISSDVPQISWFESPFRGLEAYEFRHAPIFFGRRAPVRQALDRLAANAEDGTAFLLVLGASGSGKSSLVRAGLLPALSVHGAVSDVGAWRRVLFRPWQSPGDLFLGLANRLTRQDREDEEVGLAELVHDDFTVEHLARHLRGNAETPGAPFQLALAHLPRELARRPEALQGERVRLVLVIDQLEELFTEPVITAAARERFVALLTGLARSAAVWVVATMRSDFWYRVAEVPLLAELLSDRNKVLDLWPPNPAEIAEIIRGPAAKAGVEFGKDEVGVALDARLAEDAAREPGALPLLSYALDELHRRDRRNPEGGPGRTRLRWETYRDIGFLKGAITRRADEMLAELARHGVDDRAVARVLRHLVSLDDSEGGRPVARTAPLEMFAEATPERLLVDAFLRPDMRLFIAEGDAAGARLRIAHEALLTEWERARRTIAEDAVNLARRRRLEEAERRWHNAAPADCAGLLLRAGLELNEAEALTAAWADELDPALLGYVEESRRAERRRIEDREENARRLAERLAEAQLNEARFLTSTAEAELRDGHIERALLIARAALPRDMRKPDRPIWKGAFGAIANAKARDRAIAVAVGHQGGVRSAAFSPDGRRLVTASWDGTGRLWNAADGALLATLRGHSDEVRSAAFSPDGRRVVTASADRTARLWDAATGAAVAALEGHTREVCTAAFCRDGRRVVTASWDTTARLWDAATGALLATFEGHTGEACTAAFSPDGRRVVTASNDGTARLWDAADGASLATLEGHWAPVNSAAFSPDGRRIVTASDDRTARLWDVTDGALFATLQGHTSPVNSAAFSPDGERAVTTSFDGTARLWDAADGTLLVALEGHTEVVWSAAFSLDGWRVVTASRDGTARLWDATDGALLVALEGHTDHVTSAAFSPDGRRVLTASLDGTARLWDVADSALLAIIEDGTRAISSAAFSPDGRRVLTRSYQTAGLWDAANGAPLVTLEGHTDHVTSAAFSPDGKRVVTASEDHTARLWDASGVTLATFAGHTDRVLSAAFSPDGKRVVTASADYTARLWDADEGRTSRWKPVWRRRDGLFATLEGHTDHVTSAAFSPDGRRVVTASWDYTARLWDAADGALLAILEGHTFYISCAAFSSDGRRVVTASSDHTARLWDAASGAPRAILEGHTGPVYSAAFSPDGRRIATTSEDRTARLWDAANGALLATLDVHTGRVTSAAFSPNGQRVVTASFDGTARLWDAAESTLVATLGGHADLVLGAAFSPDGRRVVTASSDKTARLWSAWPLLRDDTAAWIATAAFRALTPEERSRAFLAMAVLGSAEATPEPDRHRQLAERFERADSTTRDLERALFHYAVAVRLYEEQGREEEAAPCRMRRGSLARVLPPETAVRIAYEALDWRPENPADG
jgi:WD40 repeat protein